MAIGKPLFFIFLVICSLAFVSYSQVTGAGNNMPCIQKLLPCLSYLKGGPSSSPSPSCCVPLKQMVAGDSQCLCAVLNNKAALKNLNATLDDALGLAKTCGADADISVCTKASEAAPSPSPSANGSEPSAPRKKNGATTACHVGGSVLPAAAVLTIILFLF